MILYLSHSRLKNSVNAVYVGGLVKVGKNIEAHHIKKSIGGYIDTARAILKSNPELIIIGYDSPELVILSRLFTRKKIIYNALCSVYERMVIARGLHSRFSSYSLGYWLLDFFAVNFASLVVLETNLQIDYFIKLFRFPRKKLIRAWTGADDNVFFYDPTILKGETFTVLFRGALMPESGAEYVVQAAKILEKENINFIMQSGGIGLDRIKKTIEELKPKNLSLRSDFLPDKDLRIAMQKCHLILGQLSDHQRLERTIPHKAYESLAMRLPYLTAANKGILELLKAGETCITCESANAESLAQKILWAKDNSQEIERIAEKGYRLYQDELKSPILAKNLLDKIASF